MWGELAINWTELISFSKQACRKLQMQKKELNILNYSVLILNTGPSGGNLSSTSFKIFFILQEKSFKVFWSFFPSSSFNFCSDFVEKYFKITKNLTKPAGTSCTWKKTSQTKISSRTCSSLQLKDRTHSTIYSKSGDFVLVIDGLTKKMTFYYEYF